MFQLINPKKKAKKSSYKNSGVVLIQFHIHAPLNTYSDQQHITRDLVFWVDIIPINKILKLFHNKLLFYITTATWFIIMFWLMVIFINWFKY